MLTLEGPGRAPEDILGSLLEQIKTDDKTWSQLSRFRKRVIIGVTVSGWHRGFNLSPAAVRRLADLGVEVGFDIWSDEESAA
jgi:hypothetical protein